MLGILEKPMSYYCRRLSPASEVDTNLQLYSLQQAAEAWNDLLNSIAWREGVDRVDHLKERLVFILSCLGLSLTQLLGQNVPSPDKNKMGPPGNLLGNILACSHVDQKTRHYLNGTFQDFLRYYGSLRHFGKNRNEQHYRTIDKLTIQELDRFRRMTIEIWDVVIAIFKDDDENDLYEIRSVAEVVLFKDLSEHQIQPISFVGG